MRKHSNPLPPVAHTPGAPWPIPEVAAYLQVSARSLHRLLDAGRIEAIRLGRRRLIPDHVVQRLAREGC